MKLSDFNAKSRDNEKSIINYKQNNSQFYKAKRNSVDLSIVEVGKNVKHRTQLLNQPSATFINEQWFAENDLWLILT